MKLYSIFMMHASQTITRVAFCNIVYPMLMMIHLLCTEEAFKTKVIVVAAVILSTVLLLMCLVLRNNSGAS